MSMEIKYRFFWQGKSPRVREAVEDFLGSDKPVKQVALKHGVSIVAITNRSRQFKYMYHKGVINLPEILAINSQQTKGESINEV